MSEKILTDSEKFFWFDSSRSAKSISQLLQYIQELDDSHLAQFMGEQKNDFANWVEHVFGEQTLAKDLRSCTNPPNCKEVLEKFVQNPGESSAKKFLDIAEQEAQKEEKEIPHQEELEKETVQKSEEDNLSYPELHEKYQKKHDEIADKFDSVITQIQQNLHEPEVPEQIKKLEIFEEKLRELRMKISDGHKKNRDMFFADILVKKFPAFYALAKNSRSQEDFAKVEDLLKEIEQEISSAPDHIDTKKEILAMVEQAALAATTQKAAAPVNAQATSPQQQS